MLTQVLFLLAISSGGVLACMLSKEAKFADYYPITCMSITLMLFIFGICNILLIGFYFVASIVIVIYIIFFVFLIKTRKTAVRSSNSLSLS